MVRRCSAGVLLSLLLLLGGCGSGDGGDGEVQVSGTILSIENSVALLDVSQSHLSDDYDTISFSIVGLDDEGVYSPTVGDTVTVYYFGPLQEGDPPVAEVHSWGLPPKELTGTLLSVDETYAVIEPLDEALRQEYPEIGFSLDYLTLRNLADKGFQPGDALSILYIREIQPGDPAQIQVVDWGVADLD